MIEGWKMQIKSGRMDFDVSSLQLTFTKINPLLYKKLCTVWSSQLARMVRTDSLIYKKLNDAALGVSVLDIKDLEHCENNIISQHKYFARVSSR